MSLGKFPMHASCAIDTAAAVHKIDAATHDNLEFSMPETTPAETQPYEVDGGSSNMVRNGLLVVAVVYVAASLYVIFETRGRVEKLEQRAAQAESSQAVLERSLTSTKTELKNDTAAVASAVGMTQKQLAQRAAELRAQQKESESRLTAEQKKQSAALGGEVATVKTEVGGVKGEVATAKADIEATRAKLERAIGDLGLQSGLIAKTRDELDILKHKGDRNYYEFTLARSKAPTPVGTVSLQLKKTDAKKGKYTLNVLADDRTIEKKDRNLNEPIQFYSGRDRSLFELVVFNIDKEKVSGYLSTPKAAPAPTEAR
jgi:hypothetical protein